LSGDILPDIIDICLSYHVLYLGRNGMPYKMWFRGQEVTCDSPEEVAALVNLESAVGASGREHARGGQKTIRSVLESLSAEQQFAVNLLNKAFPEFTTDAQFREEMHLPGNKLSGNKKLAGVLAGISKAAKKANINPIVKHETVRGSAGDRIHKYWLEQDVRTALSKEVAEVREMLDGRYDEIKSGRVKPIDGEAFFDNLRQRENELVVKRNLK
jgi:hypothetical protein